MILTATAAPPTEHGSVTRTNVTSATHSTAPAKHANVSITLLFYMCFINQTFREFGHFSDTKHQLAACQLASENRHTFPLRQASICLYISFRHLSNMSSSVLVTSWDDDVIVDVRKFVVPLTSVDRCLRLPYQTSFTCLLHPCVILIVSMPGRH